MPHPFHLVRLTVAGAGLATMAMLCAAPALAARRTVARSSPSGNGSDIRSAAVLACVAPCRSFNAAIAQHRCRAARS